MKNYKVSHVVTDYSPLRINREWKNNFIKKISCNYKECVIHEVDSHNIVPVWVASTKQEVAARTLRCVCFFFFFLKFNKTSLSKNSNIAKTKHHNNQVFLSLILIVISSQTFEFIFLLLFYNLQVFLRTNHNMFFFL